MNQRDAGALSPANEFRFAGVGGDMLHVTSKTHPHADVLSTLLSSISEVFDSSEKRSGNKITWFITAGTLLGQQRSGQYIPWDLDADVAILSSSMQTPNIEALAPLFERRGLKLWPVRIFSRDSLHLFCALSSHDTCSSHHLKT